uniref:Maturase K n=1 Tax=Laminaria solidungula TaxID=309363 RepID=A0A7U1G3J2_9PHAE|nr:hypothetical protein F6D47_mgp17 [Laminaria solidungula]QQY85011.1 hypothetical protein [Laminaria solidungula]
MEKAKRYSETDLADFYVVSPVFKRYSQLNLWSENFSEYRNIKYCEIYLSQYVFGYVQKHILEHFSESFLLTLYNSPKFLKFIESGFFKYINPHFLFFFQNNRFFFSEDSYEEVETFVEEYFQRYIKIFFDRDLLICLVACLYEIVPKSFRKYLNTRLKFIYKEFILIESDTKSLSNSVVILNFVKNKKNKYYPLGFVDYKNTIKFFCFDRYKANTYIKREFSYFFLTGFDYKIYKSLNFMKEARGVLKPSFSSFFLEDTIYTWGYCLINTHKKAPPQISISNCILSESSKTSTVYKYLISKKKVESSLKAYSFLLSRYNWYFYTFSQCVYKSPDRFTSNYLKKGSNNCNFQLLLESFQVSVSFDKKRNDIGIYRESANVFFEVIKPIYLKLVGTTVMVFLKRFECNLNKFYSEINFKVGFFCLAESDDILLIFYKEVFDKIEYYLKNRHKRKNLVHLLKNNYGKFCLNINDTFDSKFKNPYTRLK